MNDTLGDALASLSEARQQLLCDALDRYAADLRIGLEPPIEPILAEFPELGETLPRQLESLRFLQRAVSDDAPQVLASPIPAGEDLGDFQLIREIGRGGMGIVFEARQRSLGRRVAVKVLPFAAVLEPRQIQRFQQEAQAAAQLHHPHIVPVYGVGCERGVHYYSMQFVEGRSLEQAITELRRRSLPAEAASSVAVPIDQAAVSTRDGISSAATVRTSDFCRRAAEIMIQAAEALQYAHECGIVHRDIKPSNLMLDTQGRVWITDFGLARVPNEVSLTLSGDMLGTLRYMSPEQAAGKPQHVDGRTDVYSLGATFFELLTLHAVHEGLDRAAVLRSMEHGGERSLRKFNSAVPHELETIVLKAIASAREDRYAEAADLAADLRRFFAGKPIAARRPSLLDRAIHWGVRHRSAVAWGALGLSIVLLATLSAAVWSRRSQLATEQALRRADANFQDARRVVDRFLSDHAARLADLPGAEGVQRDLLRESLAYYRGFIERAETDERLRGDLGSAYHRAASASARLGENEEAERDYLRAAEILRAEERRRSDVASRDALAALLNDFGLFLGDNQDFPPALSALSEAITLYHANALAAGDTAEPRDRHAAALANLALVQSQSGDEAAARNSFATALAVQERLAAEFPDSSRYLRGLAVTLGNLSHAQREVRGSVAIEYCRRALETQRKLVSLDSQDETARVELALTYNNLGSLLGDDDDFSGAEEAYRQAIAIQSQLVRARGGVVAFERDLAVSYNNLGHVLSRAEKWEDSLEAFRASRTHLERLALEHPHEANFRAVLAGVWNNEGLARERSGDRSGAVAAMREAVVIQSRVATEHGDWKSAGEALARHRFNWLRLLIDTDDESAWKAALTECSSAFARTDVPSPAIGVFLRETASNSITRNERESRRIQELHEALAKYARSEENQRDEPRANRSDVSTEIESKVP